MERARFYDLFLREYQNLFPGDAGPVSVYQKFMHKSGVDGPEPVPFILADLMKCGKGLMGHNIYAPLLSMFHRYAEETGPSLLEQQIPGLVDEILVYEIQPVIRRALIDPVPPAKKAFIGQETVPAKQRPLFQTWSNSLEDQRKMAQGLLRYFETGPVRNFSDPSAMAPYLYVYLWTRYHLLFGRVTVLRSLNSTPETLRIDNTSLADINRIVENWYRMSLFGAARSQDTSKTTYDPATYCAIQLATFCFQPNTNNIFAWGRCKFDDATLRPVTANTNNTSQCAPANLVYGMQTNDTPRLCTDYRTKGRYGAQDYSIDVIYKWLGTEFNNVPDEQTALPVHQFFMWFWACPFVKSLGASTFIYDISDFPFIPDPNADFDLNISVQANVPPCIFVDASTEIAKRPFNFDIFTTIARVWPVQGKACSVQPQGNVRLPPMAVEGAGIYLCANILRYGRVHNTKFNYGVRKQEIQNRTSLCSYTNIQPRLLPADPPQLEDTGVEADIAAFEEEAQPASAAMPQPIFEETPQEERGEKRVAPFEAEGEPTAQRARFEFDSEVPNLGSGLSDTQFDEIIADLGLDPDDPLASLFEPAPEAAPEPLPPIPSSTSGASAPPPPPLPSTRYWQQLSRRL